MNEFSLKIGSAGKGVVAAIISAVKYIVVPMLLLTAFTTLFAQMEGASTITDQLDLERIKQYVLVLGVPITVLAFFRGFYPKGTRSRFVFGEAITALVCIWIWMVMMGGNLALEIEDVGFSISYVGFVLLFILAAALGGVFYLVEMLSYRTEWLKAREPQAAHPADGAA
jgi:hypothetical protein